VIPVYHSTTWANGSAKWSKRRKAYLSTYDVLRDGTRFLVRDPKEDIRTTPLAVLLKWMAAPQR
jgi:hypothetical protein